jgi:hypothetical protein
MIGPIGRKGTEQLMRLFLDPIDDAFGLWSTRTLSGGGSGVVIVIGCVVRVK